MEFYRVYHDNSVSQYDDDEGFLAGDSDRELDFNPRSARDSSELGDLLDQHLNWYNREPTPFISMYEKLGPAIATAKAWERKGKWNVRIASIDRDTLESYGDVRYRNVRRLAAKLNIWIDPEIWQSTQHELIVLHQIPARAVNRIYTVYDLERDDDDNYSSSSEDY